MLATDKYTDIVKFTFCRGKGDRMDPGVSVSCSVGSLFDQDGFISQEQFRTLVNGILEKDLKLS